MNSKFFVCLVIALASGAAALSHELLWTRRLVDILGASGEATSLTLGCFFCGLSLGAAVAARRVSHVANAWVTLAKLECTIALLTLPAALLPHWTSWIWPALGPEALVSWSGRFVKLVISGLVVLPPATVMGMTLPVLVSAIARTVSKSPRLTVFVYASNTIGGAMGLLVTSIWLLQSFGVFGSMLVAALTNLVVGWVAWSLRSLQPISAVQLPKRERKRREREKAKALPKKWLVAMACYSGFAVLSLEVVVIRLLSLVVPSSFQATSSVLLTVILLLGVAALLVPAILRLIPHPAPLLLVFISCAGVASVLAPALLYERTKQLIDVPHLVAIDGRSMDGLWGFHREVLNVALCTVGPALLLSAAVFPTLLACIGREAKESGAVGREWAILLAANGVGGLIGTFAAEQLFLPNLGIYGGMAVVGIIQALTACIAALSLATRWRLAFVLPGAIALACCFLLNQVDKLAYVSPHTTFKYDVMESRFGKHGVCCVVKTQTGAKGIMLNNQYMLGTTGVEKAQRRQVLIPLLLQSANSAPNNVLDECRVCCLGLATGISAGAALDFSVDCSVTAVELSPTVIEVAKDHFATENRNLVSDPRARVIAEDARTYMAAVRDEYDVIAGDLYRPYASGQGRLYSLEHFQNIRQALRTGGIYCQWIPAFQVTEDHFRTIAATFVEVFPNGILLCGDPESRHPMLGLLGTKETTVRWDEVVARFQTSATQHGVRDEVLLADDFATSLFVSNLSQERFSGVRINTLENAILEINAGRHRATHDRRKAKDVTQNQKEAYLRGDVWNAFLKKMRARG